LEDFPSVKKEQAVKVSRVELPIRK